MEWFIVDPILVIWLFFISLIAAFIDSIAGGGGLLTLPMLLSSGLSPTQALATNKLQGVGGTLSASLYFVKHNIVNLIEEKLNILMAFFGAVGGSILIQYLNLNILRQLLPLLIISIGFYFLFFPDLGKKDKSKKKINKFLFSIITGGCIGFYDGFFGPGSGSFYAIAFITLYGLNLTKATAHAKVLNFASDLGGLIFFIFQGQVIWGTGLIMLLGACFGARMGARLVLFKNQSFIRPTVIIVSVVMSTKLIYDNHHKLIKNLFCSIFN